MNYETMIKKEGFVVFAIDKENKVPLVGFCKTKLLAKEFIDYAYYTLGENVDWCYIQDASKIVEFKGFDVSDIQREIY